MRSSWACKSLTADVLAAATSLLARLKSSWGEFDHVVASTWMSGGGGGCCCRSRPCTWSASSLISSPDLHFLHKIDISKIVSKQEGGSYLNSAV